MGRNSRTQVERPCPCIGSSCATGLIRSGVIVGSCNPESSVVASVALSIPERTSRGTACEFRGVEGFFAFILPRQHDDARIAGAGGFLASVGESPTPETLRWDRSPQPKTSPKRVVASATTKWTAVKSRDLGFLSTRDYISHCGRSIMTAPSASMTMPLRSLSQRPVSSVSLRRPSARTAVATMTESSAM
jgi:hypothetical protein